MKTKIKVMAAIFAVASIVIFYSCEKDVPKPVITILELGEGDSHGNDHTAIIGGELHIEAEIIAEGKIDKVNIRLHPEGDHHGKGSTNEWEIDTTYIKFSGLKNTLFHEHLEISLAAEPGDYHFDFVVTDMEGNQSNAEADVMIKE